MLITLTLEHSLAKAFGAEVTVKVELTFATDIRIGLRTTLAARHILAIRAGILEPTILIVHTKRIEQAVAAAFAFCCPVAIHIDLGTAVAAAINLAAILVIALRLSALTVVTPKSVC